MKALQEPLVNGLNGLPAEALDKPAPFSPTGNPSQTVGSLLATFPPSTRPTTSARRVVGREGVVKPPKIPAMQL